MYFQLAYLSEFLLPFNRQGIKSGFSFNYSFINFFSGPPEPVKKPPMLSQKLNFAELSVVRQLIAGYRESAAFLLRSADELENMVQLQQKS